MFGEPVSISGAYSAVIGDSGSYPSADFDGRRYYYGIIDNLTLDVSLVVPTSIENKPKSVTLLGCQKD